MPTMVVSERSGLVKEKRSDEEFENVELLRHSPQQTGPEKKPSARLSSHSKGDDDNDGNNNSNNNNNNSSDDDDWHSIDDGAIAANNESNSEAEPPSKNWLRASYDIYNQLRFRCGMLVNNKYVQAFIILLICVNAIMMGIGTFDFVKLNPEVDHLFEQIDLAFLIVFTVELAMQFIYHGWRLILDGWLVFDLVIIITSWSFSSVQIIRAFRIFRALRLITRIKIMKNLILALFSVMPRMAAIGVMLALIFYIFAVMFTQLFQDMYENGQTDYNYFSGIDWTLFTLFQMMTLDNWASIARQVIAVYKWAWVPFIAFVIISGFIVVNLIIAVICDAISALHKDDRAKLEGAYEENETDVSTPMDIREQLDCLEVQMEELTRIQARTFHTLQYMTRQIQMNKLKKELKGITAATRSLGVGEINNKDNNNDNPKDPPQPPPVAASAPPPPETATTKNCPEEMPASNLSGGTNAGPREVFANFLEKS